MELKNYKGRYFNEWVLDTKYHHPTLPAITFYGIFQSRHWFCHGKRHRAYAPSNIFMPLSFKMFHEDELTIPAHIKYRDEIHLWYVNGEDITPKIIKLFDAGRLSRDYENWTAKEKLLFKLMFL